jgi:ribosomal protein S12 methylthiotransferase
MCGDDQAPTTIRVGLIGLGCAKNTVDAEIMLGHLRDAGVVVTADPRQAEVVIVNTCGFIVDAKRESIEAILEVAQAKAEGSVRRLIVAGCMAQSSAAELAAEIPEIDDFVGLDELEQVVRRACQEPARHLPEGGGAARLYDHNQPRLLSTGPYAYLKIAEGCDNPCGFCIIPSMRGAFRSRPIEDLVAEAQQLAGEGVRELVLIAQDTTRYGHDIGLEHGLRTLVEELLDRTDLPWIRFLYAYPSTLDPGLFELMADNPRFLSYLDLPLQHASRTVLKAMRRGGGAAAFRKLVARARRVLPDLVLRTTMLVGYPGEGENEFSELMDFVAEVRFDHLGVFTYSWQEENPSAELGDPVPEVIKQQRRDRLMELQQGISMAKNRALVGQRLPALVVGPLAEMELLTEARLQRHAPEVDGRLLINDGTAAPGTIVEAEITEAHPYDVIGRVCRSLDGAADQPAGPRLKVYG